MGPKKTTLPTVSSQAIPSTPKEKMAKAAEETNGESSSEYDDNPTPTKRKRAAEKTTLKGTNEAVVARPRKKQQQAEELDAEHAAQEAEELAAMNVEQGPGDPMHPKSFIDHSSEQKTAAYLMFNNCAYVRRLAVTWPFLRALLRDLAIGGGTQKDRPMMLIHVSRHLFEGDVDPQKEWPLLTPVDAKEKEILTENKFKHMAWLLVNLENDVHKMHELSWQENVEIEEKVRQDWANSAAVKNLEIGTIIYPGDPKISSKTDDARERHIYLPYLGPLTDKGESRMESINRLWCMMTYMRYASSSSDTSVWNKKFGEQGIKSSIEISRSYMPGWMLPPEQRTNKDELLDTVPSAGALEPKDYEINWRKNTKNADFMEHLEEAQSAGKRIPTTKQKLQLDPRLCETDKMFRDSIRQLYNCYELGLDIQSLYLKYEEAGELQLVDLMDVDNWLETRTKFEGDKEFTLTVRLVVYGDRAASIFETMDPILAVSQARFSDTTSVEVRPV